MIVAFLLLSALLAAQPPPFIDTGLMGRTLDLQTPRAYAPLLYSSRYKGAYGGRGSGKSHHFAEALLERCVLKPTRAVCVREIQLSLKDSVKRLLEDKIEDYNLGREFQVMSTHINTPGEGIIIFNGMQNHTAESIKSLEGFDVAWVEEAQSLSDRSLTLLRPTIRVPDSELWFSWNPRHETDPIDRMLRGKEIPPDAIVVGTTYRDNPWFTETLRREMEWDRRRDPDKYAHVWLGGYERHSEARVFKNYRVEEFETPSDSFFYFGGDWGYSIDPTVLVRCFIKQPKTLYIDAEAYKVGCEIDHTPALFDTIGNGMARNWVITADSARPETISYLRRHGYPRIEPAVKGPNSVQEGVIFLQGYDIIIHPRCEQTVIEFAEYCFKRDPLTNDISPILEDKKNHVIDSVRYAIERVRTAEGPIQVVRARGY